MSYHQSHHPGALINVVAHHRPFDEIARSVHKQIMPNLKGVTVQAIKDTLAEMIAAGRLYEGRGHHGVRTVGHSQPAALQTVADRAADYWETHPNATVRDVAKAVGCSRSQAGRARQLTLSHASVPSVKSEHRGNGTEQRDKAAESCPIGVPLSYMERDPRDGTRSGRAERLSHAPEPSEDTFNQDGP